MIRGSRISFSSPPRHAVSCVTQHASSCVSLVLLGRVRYRAGHTPGAPGTRRARWAKFSHALVWPLKLELTNLTLQCGHFSGPSRTRGGFFDFEVGGHDRACKQDGNQPPNVLSISTAAKRLGLAGTVPIPRDMWQKFRPPNWPEAHSEAPAQPHGADRKLEAMATRLVEDGLLHEVLDGSAKCASIH